MEAIQTAIKLYIDALKQAVPKFGRSIVGLGFFIFTQFITAVAGALLAPLGFIGGIIAYVIWCYTTGMYLTLVRQATVGQRALTLQDVNDANGQLFTPVMNTMFVVALPAMIASFVAPLQPLIPIYFLIVLIVVNAGPEYLQYGDRDGVGLVQDAASFIQQNWPEWFGFNVPLLALGAALTMVSAIAWSPLLSVDLGAGNLIMGPIVMGLTTGPIVHFILIARGLLFRKLKGSSRRARAWQNRF